MQLGERRPDVAVARDTASSSGSPNCRPSTAAAVSVRVRVGLEPVDPARRMTFSTVGGTSTSTSWSNRQPSSSWTSAPASTSERTSSSRKNGLPSAGSRIRALDLVGQGVRPTSAASSSRSASPESASSASSRGAVGERRGRCPPSARHDGWSRSARLVQHEQQRAVSVSAASRSTSWSEVASAQCRSSIATATGPSSASRRDERAGPPRTCGTAGPRARARARRAAASGSSVSSSSAPRYGTISSARSPNSRSSCWRSATRTRSSGSSPRPPARPGAGRGTASRGETRRS